MENDQWFAYLDFISHEFSHIPVLMFSGSKEPYIVLKKPVAILACKPIVRKLIALPYYTRMANIIVPA
jgi:hypothetical protein